MEKKEVNISDELMKEAKSIELTPEKILLLVDMIFMGHEKSETPS